MSARSPKILADSYQLTVMVFGRTRSFPKHYRPTLGRRLEDRAIDLTSAVRVASLAKGGGKDSRRTASLESASELLDEIRILLQLAHDMQIIPTAGYAELSELTAEVGRQIGGFGKFEAAARDHTP
jgi:hypothetical protein